MRRSIVLSFALLVAAACSHSPRPTITSERDDSPDEAARYFAQKRGITPDLDVNARYAAARERIARMQHVALGEPSLHSEGLTTTIGNGAWHFLGPGNVGGRTRALLIDPNDSNVIYAGAISGGVWKTTDGGASWRSTTDFLPNIAVGSLAFDPADSSTIYAGTGEGYFREIIRGTGLPIRGNGIFVTHDAGATWQQLPSTAGEDFYWVNDLAVSTHDSQRIYAATRNGVFRSRDGGATWTRVVATDVTGGCLDLAFRGDTDNDFLFASCGMLDGAATIYRATSAESDDAWTPVLTEPNMGRTTLSIAPSNPSVVYALAARNGGTFDQGLFAVFRSNDSGAAGSWVAQVRTEDPPKSFGGLLLTNVSSSVSSDCSNPDTENLSNMGWHCNVIAVDPKDPERVWAAGVDLFRSDDGGKTWGAASYWWTTEKAPSFVHADQHVIVFDPKYDGVSNQTMLVTNDGGVYRTDNARAPIATRLVDYCFPDRSSVAFRPLNHDFGATQFYHGAVFPDGQHYLGGAQDNSTPIGNDHDGVNKWDVIFGGDGGYVAVDPVDPTVIYGESQNARVLRSTNQQNSTVIFPPSSSGTYLFISPFMLDPNQHDRIWFGGGMRLIHRDSLRSFITASTALDSHITALDVAHGNPNRMLVGTENGTIYRNDAALAATDKTTWSSTKPRDGWVSSLTFDPTDSSVAYATYAGFGGTHVWKTRDAGATWTPLDGTGDGALPDVPAHSVVVDGATLYLGTDVGIFVSTDGGNQWAAETTFPHAITERLVLSTAPRGRALFAFTHGRGAWRVDLTQAPRRRAVGRS